MQAASCSQRHGVDQNRFRISTGSDRNMRTQCYFMRELKMEIVLCKDCGGREPFCAGDSGQWTNGCDARVSKFRYYVQGMRNYVYPLCYLAKCCFGRYLCLQKMLRGRTWMKSHVTRFCWIWGMSDAVESRKQRFYNIPQGIERHIEKRVEWSKWLIGTHRIARSNIECRTQTCQKYIALAYVCTAL